MQNAEEEEAAEKEKSGVTPPLGTVPVRAEGVEMEVDPSQNSTVLKEPESKAGGAEPAASENGLNAAENESETGLAEEAERGVGGDTSMAEGSAPLNPDPAAAVLARVVRRRDPRAPMQALKMKWLTLM